MSRQNRSIVVSESEYEHLIRTIHKLQESLVSLSTLRDDLVYRLCPALRAEYDEKIGWLKRELFAAQTYLKEEQRTIEIIQAQMNARKKPSLKTAQDMAREEFKEYEEELKRKAKEAENFRRSWEKDSQWSQYEKAGSAYWHADDPGSQEDDQARAGSDGPSGKSDRGHAEGSCEDDAGRTDENQNGNRENSNAAGSKEKARDLATIRDLYRKIVKRLHPDVHPNATEHEKNLLNKANEAYSQGDLDTIKAIWDELSGLEAPEESFEDTEEGRQKLRQLMDNLQKRVRELMEEIRKIQSEFPYTAMEFLQDKETVRKKQEELQKQLDETRKEITQLEELIERLKEYQEQES